MPMRPTIPSAMRLTAVAVAAVLVVLLLGLAGPAAAGTSSAGAPAAGGAGAPGPSISRLGRDALGAGSHGAASSIAASAGPVATGTPTTNPPATGTPTQDAAPRGTRTDWILLFLFLAVTLLTSFLCSLLEAAFLSVPRSHAAVMLKEGNRAGHLLKEMKESVDRPLAGILTLNTVANTIGATGIGATMGRIFDDVLVAVGSVVVTMLILVFSEIIPKTLGAVHAKALAPFAVQAIRVILVVTYPLVGMLETISRFLARGTAPHMTRAEVVSIAEMGHHAGVLHEGESRIISNLLRLNVIRVSDVMTPRPVVFMLPETMTIEEAVAAHDPIPVSRIPVYGASPDEIRGIVLRHDLYQARWQGNGDAAIGTLVNEVHVVPSVTSVAHAMEQFTERQVHIMLVVDEFGGTAGVITLEDAIETLLGIEIVDETDDAADMRALARARMEKRRKARRNVVPGRMAGQSTGGSRRAGRSSSAMPSTDVAPTDARPDAPSGAPGAASDDHPASDGTTPGA